MVGPPNTVSWQSAFWPIVACTLAVMLQNTGSVLGTPYTCSSALRSSPFICIIDTFFMLVKFVWLLLVGCSFKVAAMHVWYDRFERDDIPSALMSINAENNTDDKEELYTCTGALPIGALGDDNQERHSTDIPLRTIPNSTTPQGPSLSSPVTGSRASRVSHGEELYRDDEIDLGDLNFQAASIATSSIQPSTSGRENQNSANLQAKDDIPEARPAEFLEGSAIDRMWRWSIASFLFGALPQAIKIFGMKGIPITQTWVAFLLVSFLVPEIFRSIAGTAGAVNLRPMPIVKNAKELLTSLQEDSVYLCCGFSVPLAISVTTVPQLDNMHVGIVAFLCSFVLAFPTAFGIRHIGYRLSKYKFVTCLLSAITPPGNVSEKMKRLWSKFVILVSSLLALDASLVEFHLLFAYVFAFCLIAWVELLMYFFPAELGREHVPIILRPLMLIGYLLVPSTLGVLLSFILFRILFVGSLSRYPCKLTGLEGSMEEFFLKDFVILNFVWEFTLYAYIVTGWEDTYKPGWADLLG